MAQVRSAEVTWEGDLAHGAGKVTSKSSNILQQQPVSWKARTEAPGGQTIPEELLAAAHAACFSMAMAQNLAQLGHPPRQLRVSVQVSFDKVSDGFRITRSDIEVQGAVQGVDAAGFQKAAETAKDKCPVSLALKGNVPMTVRAKLG